MEHGVNLTWSIVRLLTMVWSTGPLLYFQSRCRISPPEKSFLVWNSANIPLGCRLQPLFGPQGEEHIILRHSAGFGNFLLAPWSSWYNYQSCQVGIWNFCSSKGRHYQLVPWNFCCSCPKSSQKSLLSPHSWQCPLPRSSKAPWNSFGFSPQSPFPSRPWNCLMSFPIPGEDCGNYGCARTPSSSSGCFRPACSHSGSVLLPGPASSWEPSLRPIPLLGSQKFSQVAVDFHTSKKVFSLWAQMWLCLADPPLDRAEAVQKLKEQSYSLGKLSLFFLWLSFPSCEFSLCWQITTSLPGADRSGRRGKVLPVS